MYVMLAYNDLNQLLSRALAQARAAECHGFLCGQICSVGPSEHQLWQEFLDVQTDDGSLIEDCYNEIQLLMTNIIEQIQSDDFDFHLLLPTDEVSLAQRVEALSEWCYGFLNGFGVGSGEAEGAPALSEECREVLEDLAKISQVTLDGDADEADESSFMELTEYARVGTVMIFEQFHPECFQYRGSEVLH